MLRRILHRPSATLLSAGLFALSLGCALGLFALLHAALYRPVPGAEGMLQMGLEAKSPAFGNTTMNAVPYAVLPGLRAPQGPCAALVVQNGVELALAGPGGESRRMAGAEVSGGFHGALGLAVTLGRDFTLAEEQAAEDVVILSHHLWRTRFQSDPGILGRSLRVSGRACTVVGVGPAGFRGLDAGFPKDVFLPLGAHARFTPRAKPLLDPDTFVTAYARLSPGKKAAPAKDLLTSRLRGTLDAADYQNVSATLTPLPELRKAVAGAFIHEPALLTGATLMLVLLACASVALVQLAEALRRRREYLLRLALGAGPGRLLGEALLESALPALLGALGALAFAKVLIHLFLAFKGLTYTAAELDVPLGPAVWAAALGLGLLCAILTGLAPAAVILRLPMQESLREGAQQAPRQRSRELLVGLQIALSLSLLAAAAALASDLRRRLAVPTGYEAAHVALMKVEPSLVGLEGPRRQAFERNLLARVRAIPSVQDAALVTAPPMDAFRFVFSAPVEPGGPSKVFAALYATEALPQALGIPLVQGRGFTAAEVEERAPVALVTEAFVRTHWPDGRALGRRIFSGDRPLEVVGVLKDHRYELQDEAKPEPRVILPMRGSGMPFTTLLVRTDQPGALLSALRESLTHLQPDLPASELGTLEDWLARGQAPRRLATGLLALFGTLALLLSLAGLGGTLTLQALARRREWGIRMALGARPAQIAGHILRRGLLLGLGGSILGAAGTWVLGRLLETRFSTTRVPMGLPFLEAAAAMVATVLLASLLPARLAAIAPPAENLRCE